MCAGSGLTKACSHLRVRVRVRARARVRVRMRVRVRVKVRVRVRVVQTILVNRIKKLIMLLA